MWVPLLSVQDQSEVTGYFSDISDFQQLNIVSRKGLVIDQKWHKFGSRGQVFSVYSVFLTFKCLRSFAHFPFWLVIEWNEPQFRPDRFLCLYIGYIWLLNVQDHSVIIRWISDFENPWKCILKMDGPHGYLFRVYWLLWAVKCSRSVWHHSL